MDGLDAVARRIAPTLPAGLTATVRDGGVVFDIATRAGQAAVALQGAHVLHWQPAGQTHDVLWLSPLSKLGGGTAIRGGIPLCWPWFGKHADAALPQHGFARTAVWDLASARRDGETVTLVLVLPAACSDRRLFDGTADLRCTITVGENLDLGIDTRNAGDTPFTITAALHTYLRVGDARRIAITGLDGASFRDNTQNGRTLRQVGAMTTARETVALFDDAPPVHALADPVLRRVITVERTAGRSTVIWNPGDAAAAMPDIPPVGAQHFVCIESGAIGTAALPLAAGESGRVAVRLSVRAT